MTNKSVVHLVEVSNGSGITRKVLVETAEFGGEIRATEAIFNSPILNRGEGTLGCRIVATRYTNSTMNRLGCNLTVSDESFEEYLNAGFHFRTRTLQADYGDSIPLPVFTYNQGTNEIQVLGTNQTFAVFDNAVNRWVPQPDQNTPQDIAVIMLSDFMNRPLAHSKEGLEAVSTLNLQGFSRINVDKLHSHFIEDLKCVSDNSTIYTHDNKELLVMGEHGWVTGADHSIPKITRLKASLTLYQSPESIFYSGEDMLELLQSRELRTDNYLTL